MGGWFAAVQWQDQLRGDVSAERDLEPEQHLRPQVSALVASKNFLSVQVWIDGSKKPPSDRSEKPFTVSVFSFSESLTRCATSWIEQVTSRWADGHRLFSVRCRCRGTRAKEAWRVSRTALYQHPFIHSLMGSVWRELKPACPWHVLTIFAQAVISTSQM